MGRVVMAAIFEVLHVALKILTSVSMAF